jgi:hypothetical protein
MQTGNGTGEYNSHRRIIKLKEDKMEINIVGNYGGFSTLAGTPIQGATVTITGQMVWSGTTDALGKAKDINGSVPELVYGPYSVVTTKSGYTDGSGSFVVPDTTSLTIIMSLIKVPIDITVTD